MPYAAQHKRRKQQKAQKKHRERKFKPCPCIFCLNRVHLDESDVNQHIASFGLSDSTPTFNLNVEESEQETTSLTASSVSEDLNTSANSSIQCDEIASIPYNSPDLSAHHEDHDNKIEGTNDLCACETPVKEDRDQTQANGGNNRSPSSPVGNTFTGDHGFTPSSQSSSRSEDADYEQEISLTEGSSCSLKEEFLSPLPSPENSNSSHMSESEELDHRPDCLRETTEEEELYTSEKANLPLFVGSSVTVLQALCGYLAWFSEHPGTSKTALSDLLRLHHEQILPAGNNLPSSYDEAYSFVKPFLLPFVVFDVCPNDCVLFRKTDRYDFSTLTKCPTCGCSRFTANRRPARKFYYYPLGPRWKRMYGNATIAEVLQSHDMRPTVDNALLQDIIGSPAWREAYSPRGYFNAEKRGISCQLSTDGVNPFSSNKVVYSMWPIMLTVLNLPKSIRNLFSNMLLVGIIPGNGNHEAKHVDPYLEVVVDELLSLSGSTFYDGYRRAPFEFKVQLLSYVLDYPGLNKVFLSTGANALQGCM